MKVNSIEFNFISYFAAKGQISHGIGNEHKLLRLIDQNSKIQIKQSFSKIQTGNSGFLGNYLGTIGERELGALVLKLKVTKGEKERRERGEKYGEGLDFGTRILTLFLVFLRLISCLLVIHYWFETTMISPNISLLTWHRSPKIIEWYWVFFSEKK